MFTNIPIAIYKYSDLYTNNLPSTISSQSLLELADITIVADTYQITESDVVLEILPPDLQQEVDIHIHRVNLKKELITFFEDRDNVNKFLKITMINDHEYNEKGKESGVVRVVWN